MTTLNPILLAIENLGGTASIPQISSATAIKRNILQDELPKLAAEGALELVAGSVYRISPEKLTAASLTPTVRSEAETALAPAPKAKRTPRGPDKKRRKSPVSDKILAALTTLDGEGTVEEIARVAGLTTDQVSDSGYKLKRDGLLSQPRYGSYALVGYEAPVTPAAAVVEPEAPVVTDEVSEAPVEAPEADTTEAEIGVLIDSALRSILPGGVIDLDPFLLRAVANFVEAAELLILVAYED